MRLINVNTYELTQFLSRETTPAYIIASHTWLKPRRNQSQEPSCEDVEKGIHRQKAGWRKVEELCTYIKRRYPMIEWLWYDPCCIDHRHSQEVQSSIMSMFQWYQNAYCCLAYLKDTASYSDFSQSEWFTRGWTLQELLAPTYVVLLNRDQIPLGYKGPRYRNKEELLPTAVPAITTTTWIPEGILYDPDEQKIDNINPNDILGWMKNRNTSRLEDQAYCLLGLFDLSMNVRYGESEGAKATVRMKSKLEKHRAWQFENPRLRSRDLREREPSNLPFADEEVKMIIGTGQFTTSTFPYEEQPRAFFQTGKVFAKAKGTAVQKFVVVARNDRVDPDQCYVLPISTYSGGGVSRPGVIKNYHGIVYSGQERPIRLSSEMPSRGEAGMQPYAIKVDARVAGQNLDPLSRIDYGDYDMVQMPSTVYYIGDVEESSLGPLRSQFQHVQQLRRSRAERIGSLRPSVDSNSPRLDYSLRSVPEYYITREPGIDTYETTPEWYWSDSAQRWYCETAHYQDSPDQVFATTPRIYQPRERDQYVSQTTLHPSNSYPFNREGPAFFRKGRTFASSMDGRIQNFIVIREEIPYRHQHCGVLKFDTYQGRGLGGAGVLKGNHGIIHSGRRPPDPMPDELPGPNEFGMQPIPIRIRARYPEDSLDPMSRINYDSYDEYCTEDAFVHDIGDIHQDSMGPLMDQFESVQSRIERIRARNSSSEAQPTRHQRQYQRQYDYDSYSDDSKFAYYHDHDAYSHEYDSYDTHRRMRSEGPIARGEEFESHDHEGQHRRPRMRSQTTSREDPYQEWQRQRYRQMRPE